MSAYPCQPSRSGNTTGDLLLRFKKIRNASALLLALSLTTGWLATWVTKSRQQALATNPKLSKSEVLSELQLPLAVLFAIAIVIIISGITAFITTIFIGIKSKSPRST